MISLVITIKYLLLHDMIGAARKALKTERVDAEKVEVYFFI